MKIVIDIPDDDYRYIKLLHEGLTDYQTTLKLYRAVKNGTVERPQGEWKLYGMIYYCSECGHECGESGDNFCGNCGAEMRGEE